MTDGAHLNVKADDAMGKIVGGVEVEEFLTDADFEKMIREAIAIEIFSYDGASNRTARLVLEAYEKYPMLQSQPDSQSYLVDRDGEINYEIKTGVTLYNIIKEIYPEEEVFSELTGFMWGWAVNAARNILDLEPLPNPALFTIEVPDEED